MQSNNRGAINGSRLGPTGQARRASGGNKPMKSEEPQPSADLSARFCSHHVIRHRCLWNPLGVHANTHTHTRTQYCSTSEANTSTLSFDYRDFSQLWCQKHTREHTPSSSSNDRVSSLPDCWIRQFHLGHLEQNARSPCYLTGKATRTPIHCLPKR